MIFDWMLKIGASISFSYYFPLRVLLILLRSYSMRRTLENFFLTLQQALNIVLLYALNCMILAAFALVLFRNTLTQLQANQATTNYYDFYRCIVSTFVYISTADNLDPLIYQAYSVSPVFLIYFFIATVSGSFFILAMIVATFQNGFQQLSFERDQKRLLFSRTGIVAAFILLDLNGSERLGWNELQIFVDTLRPVIGEDDPQLIAVEERLQALWEHNNMGDSNDHDSIIVKKFLRLHRTGSRLLLADELKKLAQQAVHEPQAHEELLQVRKRLAFVDVVQETMAAHKRDLEEAQDDELALQRQKELQMATEQAREEVGMTVAQFVDVVEKIKWQRRAFTKDVSNISMFRQWLQVRNCLFA